MLGNITVAENIYIACGYTDILRRRRITCNEPYSMDDLFVKKKVGVIMGGQILDYEAKDILNKGRAEGRAELMGNIVKKLLQNDFSPEQVAGYLDVTVEEVLQYCS